MSKFNEDNNMLNKNEKREREVPFPYKITKVDDETNKELLECFTGERTGFVQIGPKKWLFHSRFEDEIQHYYSFEIRPDDVFVVTFPRSGTTLVQEMVWLLENNLNYQKAAEISLTQRFHFLERSSVINRDYKAELLMKNSSNEKNETVQNLGNPGWPALAKTTSRRFIKSHLPFSLLPPNLLDVGAKVIYVARNPKDVAVSYYHLNRFLRFIGYTRDFPTHWDQFERNLLPWTPYWEHVKEGWNRRNEKNVVFLFYENINKNLRGSIEELSKILGKNYSSEEYDTLAQHLKFDNFKKNTSVNLSSINNVGLTNSGEESFVRKGKTGGWKDYFDEELNYRADKWIEENLKDTDLRFPMWQ